MTAYEFHWRDEDYGDSLIGILPKRRESGERITRQSVMSWIRTILGNAFGLDFDKIYFIQVEI